RARPSYATALRSRLADTDTSGSYGKRAVSVNAAPADIHTACESAFTSSRVSLHAPLRAHARARYTVTPLLFAIASVAASSLSVVCATVRHVKPSSSLAWTERLSVGTPASVPARTFNATLPTVSSHAALKIGADGGWNRVTTVISTGVDATS